MHVRIGTNPIAWSNDDLRTLGGDTPLEVCLAQAHAVGFQGIELGHKFPRDAATLKPLLDCHLLTLISGWYSSALLSRSPAEEIRAMQPHLRLLQAMGCQVMIWCETTGSIYGRQDAPLSNRLRLADGQWAGFCRSLTTVAEYLLSQGVQLVYHHHMGTVIETADEIDRLMAGTGEAVGLLLDTGHILYAGGDPVAVAKKHGHRIRHIHCKDVRADVLTASKAGNWSFLDSIIAGVYTVPGDGCIDFPAVLTAIDEAGYPGSWLVVEAEQDPARANPFEYGVKGLRYLQRVLNQKG